MTYRDVVRQIKKHMWKLYKQQIMMIYADTLKKVVLLYNMDLYLRTKKAGFLV